MVRVASATARIMRLRHAASLCVKAHVGLTLVSLGYGTLGHHLPLDWVQSKRQLLVQDKCFDAKHYHYLTEFIQSLYSGKGVTGNSSEQQYCQLDPNTTFEDPAAMCSSPKEVEEAFRALAKMQPESFAPPRCVHVEPMGSSYAMDQTYLGGTLSLQSLLTVHIQLQTVHTKGFPESQFLITKMEEQWNGVPLLTNYLFWIPRRVNGWFSYQLTSRLV